MRSKCSLTTDHTRPKLTISSKYIMNIQTHCRNQILLVAEYQKDLEYRYLYFRVNNIYPSQMGFMKFRLFETLTRTTFKCVKEFFKSEDISLKILQYGDEILPKINSKLINLKSYEPLIDIVYYHDGEKLKYKSKSNEKDDYSPYKLVVSKYKIIHHNHTSPP